MKDLYKILEIDKSSNKNDIKRAYKKMAFKHHPDKGGDTKVMLEINAAWEILKIKHSFSIILNLFFLNWFGYNLIWKN